MVAARYTFLHHDSGRCAAQPRPAHLTEKSYGSPSPTTVATPPRHQDRTTTATNLSFLTSRGAHRATDYQPQPRPDVPPAGGRSHDKMVAASYTTTLAAPPRTDGNKSAPHGRRETTLATVQGTWDSWPSLRGFRHKKNNKNVMVLLLLLSKDMPDGVCVAELPLFSLIFLQQSLNCKIDFLHNH